MVEIITFDRCFTVVDGDSRIGLGLGDASYEINGDNIRLYYVDSWFYKQPLKSFDMPIKINGQVYDKTNIVEGLVAIFPAPKTPPTP